MPHPTILITIIYNIIYESKTSGAIVCEARKNIPCLAFSDSVISKTIHTSTIIEGLWTSY